jgi:hypothetical protein
MRLQRVSVIGGLIVDTSGSLYFNGVSIDTSGTTSVGLYRILRDTLLAGFRGDVVRPQLIGLVQGVSEPSGVLVDEVRRRVLVTGYQTGRVYSYPLDSRMTDNAPPVAGSPIALPGESSLRLEEIWGAFSPPVSLTAVSLPRLGSIVIVGGRHRIFAISGMDSLIATRDLMPLHPESGPPGRKYNFIVCAPDQQRPTLLVGSNADLYWTSDAGSRPLALIQSPPDYKLTEITSLTAWQAGIAAMPMVVVADTPSRRIFVLSRPAGRYDGPWSWKPLLSGLGDAVGGGCLTVGYDGESGLLISTSESNCILRVRILG